MPTGFDFGDRCDGGEGRFAQSIVEKAKVDVGIIPRGKANVRVSLMSPDDVDVQLIDVATGAEIVAWPNGLLSGAAEGSVDFHGVSVTYSGYNGDGTLAGLGNEFIALHGVTNRQLLMKAFGYKAGAATIEYSWTAPTGCQDQGQGAFQQLVQKDSDVVVGEIPAGKDSVVIRLTSAKDVDVRLVDSVTGTQIIAWPDGKLSGPARECTSYAGQEYCYSGYNGDQTAAGLGNEWISIRGITLQNVRMSAFGYASGEALVEYSWSQSGFCSGAPACVVLPATLPYNETMSEARCTRLSSCTWFEYDGL